MIEVKTLEDSQKNFIAAEKAILDCEQNLSMLSALSESHCFIQSISKNIWLITSKQKPAIQVHIILDEQSGTTRRLNWRQSFE
jgi:hypothetical protein